MIKLEALRVFISVAELGNIKEAARKLGRTASAVSMTLKQLEDEIGSPLFASDRKSSLTALGTFMLDTGRLQVAGYDKAIRKIYAFADNRIGNLSLASVPSVATTLIPILMPAFVASRPDVEIELFDDDSHGVAAMVETGQADMGIAGQPPSDALLTFVPLFRDRYKVICSSTNRLMEISTPLEWTDLEGEALILNGASDSILAPGYQKLKDEASFTIRNVSSLMAHAKSGLGITILPALASNQLPEGVSALPIADTSVSRTVGLIERRGTTRNPIAEAFLEFLLEEMPGLTERLKLTSY
ncbi:LysR family transcriptional regulator [Sneathiella marina]|uniref:LysR family transcriptional regulator n=1 Tax=Sneathiella marina TaxID=2950108 RepID=A0ABY4W4L7_9PROT|nr:LysR family transcriptional regulator [Sneathiella marina]USG60670.1 LysR family transcriptional regulator [Sneathiella marina]